MASQLEGLLQKTQSARSISKEIIGRFLSLRAIHFIIIQFITIIISFPIILFNLIQFMRIIFIPSIRTFTLHNISFISINKFHFARIQTKLFKRRQKPHHQLLPIQPKIMIETNNIGGDKLLQDYERYFKEQRDQLPKYLRSVSKMIDKQTMALFREKLHGIYYQLNRCSSQLVLKSHQYLQILIFIDKYLLHSQSANDQIVNNGFEHRATMLAATFLLNRQFSISQAVAIFQILTRIGCVSMLFLVNLTKFLKLQFQSQKASQSIRLEHILIILNTYFLKNNHTILQNVLYDMSLHYLLQHHQLTKSISCTLKFELICLLMRIDVRYFYLSQQSEVAFLNKKLVDQLRKQIKKQNIDVSLVQQGYKQNEININHIIYLAQSHDFAASYFKYRHTNSNIGFLIQDIGVKLNSQAFIQYKYVNINSLMRVIVNRHLGIIWQIKQVKDIMLNCERINQSMFQSVIDQYYSKLYQEKDNLSLLIDAIWQIMIEKTLFFPSIAKIVINKSNPLQLINQIQLIKLNSNINPLFMHILLVFAKYKNQSLTKQPIFIDFQDEITKKVVKMSEDKIGFMNSILQVKNGFKDDQFFTCWLKDLIKMNWGNYLKIGHPNSPIRDHYQVNYIQITCLLLSKQSTLSLPCFSQHNIYSYLLLLYPQHHPQINQSRRRHNFLSNDESFCSNIRIVDRLVGNFDKYYYLLWDIFINNYVQRSSQVRTNCFGLLKHFFLKAYNKQSVRKVVLLTTLTNYISEGTILANKSDLQQLIQMCLDPLVDSRVKDKFHYHCFLQITFNCRSAGILSNEYFSKIIFRMLSPQNCDPKSFKTSTLMLLYGHTLKNSPKNYYILYYQEQRKYLKDVLNKKLLKITIKERLEPISKSHKFVLAAGTKFLCVLLEFAQIELLPYLPQIVDYIKSCYNFSEIMQMIYSFRPLNLDLSNKQLKQMGFQLNKAFLNQIGQLHKHHLMEEEHLCAVMTRLAQNEAIIIDSL